MSTVVTRIAPSPTGQMHIGTVRSALFNYLWAKHNRGTFLVRIEDTDTQRNRPEWTQMIWDDFAWCGLVPDKKYIQSEHIARHQALLEQLVREGKAYLSREPSKNEPGKEVEVVRLKNAGKRVSFDDLIRGEIVFDTAELGDFVIARSLTEPLYHFAVVVDDADAQVSHVIRGEDILSSTPRQILIQEALGIPRPIYAHLPLILSADRKKLSKRQHVVSLAEYRDEGFLPEAIINYLALLGWNPGTSEEHFSLSELVERFSFEGVQKSGAIFDRTKLLSVNQHWMRALSDDDFIARGNFGAPDAEKLKKAVPLLKERAHTFAEARELLSGELSGLFSAPALDPAKLTAKELPERPWMTKTALETLQEAVKSLSDGVSAEAVKEAIMPLADAEEAEGKGGRGAVLWPLRYALSGQERSPDPFTLVAILGPDESVSRIQNAIAILKG
ncbi:MAG TPA: glutamate--tRNA ligase family protein [Candidatus Paceibacterota bacterium]|nr:glutamate--tRNA ligase family protein [Candidatus Paceibacterota bacterium]